MPPALTVQLKSVLPSEMVTVAVACLFPLPSSESAASAPLMVQESVDSEDDRGEGVI